MLCHSVEPTLEVEMVVSSWIMWCAVERNCPYLSVTPNPLVRATAYTPKTLESDVKVQSHVKHNIM